ncbi:MAG: pantetheine-phosphate adenylyltransferase [Gammaproteobacteria bacterium]|jgi:pantetheine-phosphate adenylyltransferase|nr:pantetheine-phosphate adenylyltransferase [Gammaproteobacteria bacterium]
MTASLIALYPGTFDPVTLAHIDIIERSAQLFSKLIVGVATNMSKRPLFDVNQRCEWITDSISHLKNVEVKPFNTLLVDFAKAQKASVVVRGLRGLSDLEYELQMANANRALLPNLETVFLTPPAKTSYISSSLVREVALFGGDLTAFVPRLVAIALADYFQRK